MDKNRVQQLVEFFYSSDNANDVPIRIAAVTGQYSMFNLNPESLAELLDILENSTDLKSDLLSFRDRYEH